ncbi:uridine kinase family protein [Aeromicrobium sp.]|uniref:uridine kinase family protein n=1 Tax=Aeromicrobium sp. TaxID=1871063 RepID=UPI002FC7219A
MADLEDIIEAIDHLRPTVPRIVVAITGFGGAGKSTLSRALVEAVPGSVRLHGDDFLDPMRSHLRSRDWDGVERSRIRSEVVEPFRRGEPAIYRPYDWNVGALGPLTTLPEATVLIVDAIALLHPELEGCFDLTVWVDVDLETAAKQGIQRDRQAGSDHDALWDEVWVPNDREFAKTYDPIGQADLLYRAN